MRAIRDGLGVSSLRHRVQLDSLRSGKLEFTVVFTMISTGFQLPFVIARSAKRDVAISSKITRQHDITGDSHAGASAGSE